MPLAAAIYQPVELNTWHFVAIALFITGFLFETASDWQLVNFKRHAENKNRVLSSGLWRYSRHPNYFGEAVVWWSFFLFAMGSGAVWTVFAPVLMTLLLLKVSGVTLMEKDISERRPAYREYIETTSAFIPWLPKQKSSARVPDGEHS